MTMNKELEDALNVIGEHRKLLRDRYSVKKIGVFGSFARGEQKTGSDIDILVEFHEVPDLFEFLNLERYMEKILGKKVDLVRKAVLRKELKKQILHEVVNL